MCEEFKYALIENMQKSLFNNTTLKYFFFNYKNY